MKKVTFTPSQKQLITAAALAAVVFAFYRWGRAGLLLSALSYVLLGLLLLVGERRKYGGWFLELLRLNALLTQGLRSFAGVLLALVFMLSLFSWFADGVSTQQGALALGALVLAAGTVVWMHWLTPVAREVLASQRTVLVSGLSKIDDRTITALRGINSLQELENRILQEGATKTGSEGVTGLSKNRLVPVLAVLARFQRVEQLIFITFSDTLGNGVAFKDLCEVIKNIFPTLSGVKEIRLGGVDINDAEEIFEELKKKPQISSLPYDETVFAITSGTAAFSSAIMLLALRGQALPVYFRQGDLSRISLSERVIEFKNWDAERAAFVLQEKLDRFSKA